MIDIHTHILPGLDDGSPNLDVSLRMAEIAAEHGTTSVVATVHADMEEPVTPYFIREMTSRRLELNRLLEAERIPLTILPGMEIYATEDIRRKIEDGLLIGINHSKYYLVEFPFDAPLDYIEYILQEMRSSRRVIPVIAHPERYYALQNRPEALFSWMQEGCMSQVNKGSLFGRFGTREEQTATLFLQHNLVTCLASDAHHDTFRRPTLDDGWAYLDEFYSEYFAEQILNVHPKQMIQDRNIDVRWAQKRPKQN